MKSPWARSGFTLLEISIVMAIIGVILASGMTLSISALQKSELTQTQGKLRAIQQALYNFRLAFNRIPCPADVTQAQGATAPNTFGIEAATPGTCTGGTPAANFSATEVYTGTTTTSSTTIAGMSSTTGLGVGDPVTGSGIPAGTLITAVSAAAATVTLSQAATATASGVSLTFLSNVEGMVPTKALRLTDDYAFDGWGRRIMYAVNVGFTATNAFTTIPGCDTSTRMTIDNASDTSKSTTAGYVLLSMGPDGHGAYPRSGGSTRFNYGSINADELTNCGCNSNGTTNGNGITGTFVQKFATQDNTPNPLNNFDDMVAFATRSELASPTENSPLCATTIPGFRVNGNVANGETGYSVAVGDVNGDGIQDLIIGAGAVGGGSSADKIYVIFGTRSGFANPLPVGSLNGSNGFTLTSSGSYIGGAVAAADLDHDGYADIISSDGNGQVYVFYGHAAPFTSGTSGVNNSTYDVATMTACQGFEISGGGGSSGSTLVAGDVNGDGIADLVIGDPFANSNKGKVYVLFGQTGTKTCPGTGSVNGTQTSIDPTTLKNTSSPAGLIINGPSATGVFGMGNLAVGNVTGATNGGNPINDIVIGDSFYSSNKGRVYVVLGQSSWPSASANTIAAGSLAGSGTSPYGFIVNGAGAVSYLGASLAVGDVTGHGNGIADILAGTNNSVAVVIQGSASAWAASYNVTAALPGGTPLQFTNSAAGSSFGNTVGIGDINHDGVGDLIIGDPGSNTTYGSTYVIFGGHSLAGFDVNASPLTGSNGFQILCPYANPESPGPPNTCGMTGSPGADINGDGIQDVIIGVQTGSVTGSNQEGYVYVLFGKASGWPATYNLSTIY